jgi:hypothetical protein
MRAIDYMTPEELETLKLKGMLAMRHTPYAANEDEAKDYELDRLEREQEITKSEDREHMKRMLQHARKVRSRKEEGGSENSE